MAAGTDNTVTTPRADEKTLRQYLADIISDTCGGNASIVRIDCKPSEYSSWYASDIVTVELSDGDQLRIFLKNFGCYKHRKDGMEQRRERELRVYKQLLAEANLGSAKYYGSVWDESRGRYWLLLEFVEGTVVRYCEFQYWLAAVEWLGRMHAYFARHVERLERGNFLQIHDADFFWRTADVALRAVNHISAPLGDRLVKVIKQYHGIVGLMASQPKTLVHGAYLPSQILVNTDTEPLRICPLDWELAGIGSGLYDLAFFTDGFRPPQLDQLWDAYSNQAATHGVSVPDRDELRHRINCFRLHKVLNWLSQSVDRQYSLRDVAKLVGMAEQLGTLVLPDTTARTGKID